MGRKKQMFVLPHLVDAGGDLKKSWFVEYCVRDPYTDEMKRFREYGGFKQLPSAEERYALAEKIIADIGEKILGGWSPLGKQQVTYEDNLLMDAVAKRWGSEREGVVTIRKHLSEFLELKKAGVSKKSYQTYQSKLRIFCEWAEANGVDQLHVSAIKTEHIVEFLSNIAIGNNLSRLTMQKYGQILHCFFDHLCRLDIVRENPVRNLPHLGKVVDQAPKPIGEEDRRLLLAAIRKHDRQLWIVCQLQYYCAIRPGECRLLKVGDVDFEEEVIRVPKEVSKNRETEPVAMPAQMVKRLRAEGYADCGRELFLFSASGKPGIRPLGKNYFRNRFNIIRDKLGLPASYKLYSFKYTGATSLVNAGIDTWELQRHLRHKSIDTTEHYVRKNFAVKSSKIKEEFPDI